MKKREIRDYIILAFFIMLIYFVVTRFTNVFGSDTDWINQHTVIPDYFRKTFYSTGKLLPNLALNYGGGQNIFALSYYGLLSPIILPSYLLPFISMSTYITIINLIICLISGILFYKWLKNNNYSDDVTLIASILFVTSASFIFHMHRHMMFVNYMPFLLISLMGVDDYIKKNKKIKLISGIFLMIMTSYYYSVCGILVIGIYFIYTYLKNNEFKLSKFIKDTIIFILHASLGILLAAFFLLPTLYTMLGGRTTDKISFDLIKLLIPYKQAHKIFAGTYSLGLSMIGFMSLAYLFYTRKHENIVVGVLTSIILFIPIFMFLLNGGLYLREKCFIPFMPLIGLFIALFINDLFNTKINPKTLIIYMLCIFIPIFLFNKNEFRYYYIPVFLAFIPFINKKYIKILLSLFIIGMSLSTCIMENNKEEFVSTKTYNEIFSSNIDKSINNVINNDNSYYRFANLINKTKTINKIYNNRYYTTNIYSSTYNYNYLDFVRDEINTSMLEYNYFMIPSYSNIIFNRLMGVKYVMSNENLGYGYTKISDNVYKNDLALPLIYARSNILNEKEYDDYKLYPYNLEYLLNNVVVDDTSSDKILDTTTLNVEPKFTILKNNGVDITKKGKGYVLKVENEGYLKIKLEKSINDKLLFIRLFGLEENTCHYDNISMKINNDENILTCSWWNYPTKNNTFDYLISDEVIDILNIKLTKGNYKIDKIEAFTMEYSPLLNNNYDEFNIKNIKNDTITGSIDVSNDNSYLVTSIPFDKGFKAYVDNKEVKIKKVNKGFIGFRIDKGHHDIKITYSSPLLKEGSVISVISLLVFIVILVRENKNKNKNTLKKAFKKYKGKNLAKEITWDNKAGKEIW